MKGVNWAIALAGLLELIAPFVLGFSSLTAQFWSNVVVGIVLIILGVWAALSVNLSVDRTLDWINAVIGIWMIVSPFVLGSSFNMPALWTNIILGIVTLVLGVWSAMREARLVTP